MTGFNDTDKGLILIYASSNHQMRVNYKILCDKVKRFTENPANKKELVNVLRNVADKIETRYPEKPKTPIGV